MQRAEILQQFESHEILPTPQRLEVADILLEKPQHLSADEIIDRLRGRGSTVSKATVYNTLNLFGKKGLIKEVNVNAVRRYYDSTNHPHHHFYNVDTGELTDIASTELHVRDLPALPEGTTVESVEIVINVRNA